MTQIQMVQTAPSGQMLDLRIDQIVVRTHKRVAWCLKILTPLPPIIAHKSNSKENTMYNIVIDEEFSGICPKLTAEEKELLEESIKSEGCRDQLIVWVEYPHEQITCDLCHENTLLERKGEVWVCDRCGHHQFRIEHLLADGHHRHEICERHQIDFQVEELQLNTRAKVVNWIINNQLGRRNLTTEQASYLRGKRYNVEKEQGKRTDLTSGHNVQKSQELADEYNVNEKTIRRDGKYAEAVDKISDTFGESVKQDILNREVKVSKQNVQTLGKLADEVSADDDRPPLMQRAEKMQDLLDELPDDVQEYILDNNENEFTFLEEAVRKGHKREKLRSDVEAYPRSDREIAFAKEAAEVWESIDEKGLRPREKFSFRDMRNQALRILTTQLRIPDLYSKLKWLKNHDESERMAWIAESREQAEYYVEWAERIKQEWKQAKKDVKDGTFFLDDADIGESSVIEKGDDDYALILTHAIESLPTRLQRKVFNDALKRYHSDKLSDVDDEQERQDCAEILQSLLGAKDGIFQYSQIWR